MTNYAAGTMPNTTYGTGTQTGYNVYIGSTNEKHYACSYSEDYNKEICLSQPYTQYGLDGHTVNNTFTNAEQTNAINVLVQVYNNAGIPIDATNCSSNPYNIKCQNINDYCYISGGGEICEVRGTECGINRNGTVSCINAQADFSCVSVDGTANC